MSLPTSLTLEIVTPDRPVVRVDVDEVIVPAAHGYLGVLPGHTPLLATLEIGSLSYRRGKEVHEVAVAYGFAEILPDRVTVLAQMAERAEDISLERAEAAHKRAQDRVAAPNLDVDFERARIAMLKALVRQQVATRARTRT